MGRKSTVRRPKRRPHDRAPFAAASNIFSKAVLTSLVAGGLLAGMPLMFTALGETISERAGVLNLGLEGMMLLGAYLGFLGAYYGALGVARLPARGDGRHDRRLADGVAVRVARARPDRRRDRDHARRRGDHQRAAGRRVRVQLPAPRRALDGLDPPARQDPRARAEPVRPAAARLHRVRVRRASWSGSSARPTSG